MDSGAGGRFDRVVGSHPRTREGETAMQCDTAGTAISEAVGFGAVARRMVAVMPLRAVTDRYGEGGLRELGSLPALRGGGVPPVRAARAAATSASVARTYVDVALPVSPAPSVCPA
jgi:hypothetical protein